MNYKEARRDFERLERIAELSDQMELDAERLRLMENPCQAVAAEMYASGIRLWFREHGVDSQLADLAEKYNAL